MFQMIIAFLFGIFVGYFLAAMMHSASTYSRDGEFDPESEEKEEWR